MSLKYAILGLLEYDSMTGYNLKKLFDESINNFWAASLSQIYRELGELERKGWLTSVIQQQSDRPDKRIYSITTAGESAFKDWITDFPQKISKKTRDEFSLRIFFGSHLSREEIIRQFERFITEKKKQIDMLENLKQLSGRYKADMNLVSNEDIYWRLVIKRALMTAEMLIGWASGCIEELKGEL